MYGYLYYSYTSPIHYIMDFWEVNRVLKSFCDYRLSATIGGQRLSSDYRLLNDFRIVSDYSDYDGAGASLVGWAGAAGWVLPFRGSRAGALPHGSGPGGGFRPSPFAFLVAAAGGTAPETPVKAAERPHTAFLWRGSIRRNGQTQKPLKSPVNGLKNDLPFCAHIRRAPPCRKCARCGRCNALYCVFRCAAIRTRTQKKTDQRLSWTVIKVIYNFFFDGVFYGFIVIGI